MDNHSFQKNPSRKTCEEAIRRILMTEVLEQGKNCHFKTAMDFMSYFESLYPSSPSLTKQVQRAIKSMNLPKDKQGYFVIDKTPTQLAHDSEISGILYKTKATLKPCDDFDFVFLSAEEPYKDYLYLLLSESETLKGKYITIINSSNGILFLTKERRLLEQILQSLISNGNP